MNDRVAVMVNGGTEMMANFMARYVEPQMK